MDNSATYYELLIGRYLSGEADTSEVKELEAWIKVDPDNEKLFTSLRDSWALTMAADVENNIDVDNEWESFAKNKGIPAQSISRKLFAGTSRRISGIAAAMLILIIPSIVYFLFFMNAGDDILIAQGQVVETVLSDGTEVSLNTGSTLHYPAEFKGNERKVALEGEAYFDVAHNKEKAFVIDAEDMQIRVLGTSFYVNTDANNSTMEVVLMEGSVELKYEEHVLLMLPGDKAIVDETSKVIIRQENKDLNLLAWKTRKLQFNDTPLGEIVDILEKVYQKDIVILNPNILNCRITATFDGQSLEAVLKVLQSTINITTRPNGNTIEISGEACQ